MSRWREPGVIARYRALFCTPGFARLLVSSILGRLPVGMFSLAVLLFIQHQTGSFLSAGVAVGSFTLAGALVGPLLGALVDRLGQTRVLLGAAVVQSAGLLALVLVARAALPLPIIAAVAALAGAPLPPMAGCTRALWAEVAHGEALETAYALDATTQEVIWTLGPLLVGGVAGLVSPAAGVLLCAVVTLAGVSLFAATGFSRGWCAQATEGARGSALGSYSLRTLLLSILFAGAVIGAIEVGMPALAVHQGARWAAGPLMAVFSLGSMTGGLLYSAFAWRRSPARRYALILLAITLAVAPLIVLHSLAPAFALSALAGLGIAPMISCQFSLVGVLAPAGTATEAFTWHRAATVAGMAGGSALGGSLIDAHGVGPAFAVGCAGVAVAFVITVLARRRIEPAALVPASVEGAEPVALAAATASAEGRDPAPEPMALAAGAVALAAEAMGLAAAEAVSLVARAVGLAADALELELEQTCSPAP